MSTLAALSSCNNTHRPSPRARQAQRIRSLRHNILLAAAVAGAGLWAGAPAAFADPATGFNQAGAGPYDYNSTANWVGSAINGIWNSDLALTADQTVTFGADTALTTGWTFNQGGGYWTGNPAYYTPWTLTLKGSGGDRTVTLGGDVSMNPLIYSAVAIGSQTAGERLNIDLGSASRVFTISGGMLDSHVPGWQGSGSTYQSYVRVENAITSASGTYGITVNGAGPGLGFRGANSYSGATTVNGARLSLDYSVQNNSKLSDSAPLLLGGGNILMGYGSHEEIVGSTTINAGASSIWRMPDLLVSGFVYKSTAVLNLNTISRNVGGTVNFGHALYQDNTGQNIAKTDNSNVNGILGSWAVVITGWGPADVQWAAKSADSLITAYNGYTNRSGSYAGGTDTNNSRIQESSLTLTGNWTTNSLKIESGSSNGPLNLGNNTLTLTSGGLLNAGANPFTITGTAATGITAGAGNELIFHVHNQWDAPVGLIISAVIGDNGNAVSLTKSGAGILGFAKDITQTYSGPTYVNEGWLLVDGTLAAGGGAVTVSTNGITSYYGTAVSALCGSGRIDRPVVLNDGARIVAGSRWKEPVLTWLTLGSDLTVPHGALARQDRIRPADNTVSMISVFGTATINGTFTDPHLEMQSGSMLKGTGTLYPAHPGWGLVTLKNGATLRPGGSIGNLTSGVDIVHEPGSIFAWEAKGYTTETDIGTAGTDYSQLAMNSGGKFTLAPGTLGKLYFPAGEDFAGSFWNSNRAWNIITGGSNLSSGSIADGNISVFVNNTYFDDWTISGQGAFSTAYVSNGTLQLTWTAIPEPGTIASVMGLGALALLRRRRNRKV